MTGKDRLGDGSSALNNQRFPGEYIFLALPTHGWAGSFIPVGSQPQITADQTKRGHLMGQRVPFLESFRLEIKSARPRDNGELCLPLSRWRGGGNKADTQRKRVGEGPVALSPGVRCSRPLMRPRPSEHCSSGWVSMNSLIQASDHWKALDFYLGKPMKTKRKRLTPMRQPNSLHPGSQLSYLGAIQS